MHNNLVFIIVSIDHLLRKPQLSWDLGFFSIILAVSALARPGVQGRTAGHGLEFPPVFGPRAYMDAPGSITVFVLFTQILASLSPEKGLV